MSPCHTDSDLASVPVSSRSKHQRKRLAHWCSHKTTPKPLKQLSVFGVVKQHTEHHWSVSGAFGMLDWWPHKGKWSINKSLAEAGDFKAMIARLGALKQENGEG